MNFRLRLSLYSQMDVVYLDELHTIECLRIQLGIGVKESKYLIRISGVAYSTGVFKHCLYCGENLQHTHQRIK